MNLYKTAPAFLAAALLTASQIGCRSCGGSHLDYGSPVAGCACAGCEGGCRAGSAYGGEGEVISDHVPYSGGPYTSGHSGGYDGEVIIGESESVIPAPPQP